MITPIDELNVMSQKPTDYFGEMGLTEEQIQERIDYTEQANEAILDAMYLIDTMRDYSAVDYSAVKDQLEDQMLGVIASFVMLDDYLRTYASDFSQNFVDATQRHEDQDWYLSEDRALFNAENSANDTINYKEYKKAIEEGKTHKKWISKNDPKVRHTHMMVDGEEIPIEETFVVGDALMRFPKDYELAFDAPQETVNCRCRIKYFEKRGFNSLNFSKSTGNDILKLPDEQIFRTLSAAARNYDVMNLETGEFYHFAEGTRIRNVEVFAGKGASKPYLKAYIYAERYGGNPEDWQHVKGFGTLDTPDGYRDAEVHWSQCEGYGKHDHFVKRWLD